MIGQSLRPGIRIARREARRHWLRSTFVVAMIALPIAAVTSADVIWRTFQLDNNEQLVRRAGAADVRVDWVNSDSPIAQNPMATQFAPASGAPTSAAPAASTRSNPSTVPAPQELGLTRLQAKIGQNTHLVAVRQALVNMATPNGIAMPNISDLPYSEPIAAGIVRPVAGRSPSRQGEAAVSDEFAKQSGIRIGSVIHSTDTNETLSVVGIVTVLDPSESPGPASVYVVPDELTRLVGTPAGAGKPDLREALSYLGTTPGGVSWSKVEELNALGYTALSRNVVAHPPSHSDVPYYVAQQDQATLNGPATQQAATIALIASMVLLEVVLVVGPAFAVSARSRRHDLALIAATGGERRDLRNIVLADGIVMGVGGSICGVIIGVGAARLLVPAYSRLGQLVPGHFDVRPLELVALAVTGIVTGIAAALLPARGAARQDVVASLSGKRELDQSTRKTAVVACVCIAAGVMTTFVGWSSHSVAGLVAGAVMCEIGAIACVPVVLSTIARLGGWLPLSLRLAVRDASRNRSSAGSAAAAVMTAVAGCVALSMVIVSSTAFERLQYQPQLPYGDALAQNVTGDVAAKAEALRSTLPAQSVAVVRTPMTGLCMVQRVARCVTAKLAWDPTAQRPGTGSIRNVTISIIGGFVVDDGTFALALGGPDAQAAAGALRDGRVVVYDNTHVKAGQTTLNVEDLPTVQSAGASHIAISTPAGPNNVSEPAFAARSPEQNLALPVLIPTTIANRLGLSAGPPAIFVHDRRTPTGKEIQAATKALGATSYSPYVEKGYNANKNRVEIVALAGAAALITLVAAGFATALANVEGESDLAIMAAVGAQVGVRRRLSMARAGLVSGVGGVLGALCGFVPSIGLILLLRSNDSPGRVGPLDPHRPIIVPWSMLGAVIVVVPLLAIVVAGLFTRGRLEVETRHAPLVGR